MRIEMTRFASVAVVLALAVAAPALGEETKAPPAQVAASAADQCRMAFRNADTNQDGILSGKELVAAKLAEADDGPLTLPEFLAECLDNDD
jgi:hypothetical protein